MCGDQVCRKKKKKKKECIYQSLLMMIMNEKRILSCLQNGWRKRDGRAVYIMIEIEGVQKCQGGCNLMA